MYYRGIMIGRQRLNKDIISVRHVACPACNKNRLMKAFDEDGNTETTSDETVDVRGETRFLDVCSFCIIQYQKTDEQFIKTNLKKIQQAVSVDPDSETKTDHKDFSLDI